MQPQKQIQNMLGRSLTGERGLKQFGGFIATRKFKSLPHGGAWIETPAAMESWWTDIVAPSRGSVD